MECAVCGKQDFTEIWISGHGLIREESSIAVPVSTQILEAKVPLPGANYPELDVGYPDIVAEWYRPAPRIRTFACYHCGYVMTFVELNEEIRLNLQDLARMPKD
jgi:RNA polymerase subunit RPABC4/transcription elongation factor Spt4